LFGGLPDQAAPPAAGRGMPRLRQPERNQPGWQIAALDDLVARDHPVRAVWAFVGRLDLRDLHDAVKAREGVPGQAPPVPELMLALWLWATVDGVGSARQLNKLCQEHLAYRWLCGGVSMNYHTLADFRTAHGAVLERLLADGVAALWPKAWWRSMCWPKSGCGCGRRRVPARFVAASGWRNWL